MRIYIPILEICELWLFLLPYEQIIYVGMFVIINVCVR